MQVDLAVNIEVVPQLRRHFSKLFDDAALLVQRAGLDLDDVVLERYLMVSRADRPHLRVIAHPLSDADRLIETVYFHVDHQPERNPCCPSPPISVDRPRSCRITTLEVQIEVDELSTPRCPS